MTTRLHSIEPALADGAPVVITARAAKFLAGFWASLADYMPGYAGRHGVARLDPCSDGLPLLLFTEDRTEPATGTAAIRISSDDLDGDIAALERVRARVIERGSGSATMADPEGNVFTLLSATCGEGQRS